MKHWIDRWFPWIACLVILWIVLLLCIAWRLEAHTGGERVPHSVRDLRVADPHSCTVYHDTDYYYVPSELRRLLPRYLPYSSQIPVARIGHDIEHIVARHEAHVSGACHWHHLKRREFARDLLNITLATQRVNRVEKSDRDFARWRPAHNVTWFAQRVVDVKVKWKLSADREEWDALRAILERE